MKRISIFVLLCVLVFTAGIACAEGNVAKYNNQEYSTLQKAVTAASKDAQAEIQLTADTKEAFIRIYNTADIILDLNGKTITGAIGNMGKLTVINKSETEGIISGDGGATYATISVVSNTNTTLGSSSNASYNNFKISSTNGAVGFPSPYIGSTINIYGGTYEASDNAVLAANGGKRNTDTNKANTFNIYGGTFNGKIISSEYVACGIYASNYDIWNLYGGTFNITRGAGIVVRAGQVNIPADSTVKFTTTKHSSEPGKVGDKKTQAVVKSAAIVLDKKAGYPGLQYGDCKITVAGGTFNSDTSVGCIQVLTADSETKVTEVTLTGGTFSSDDIKAYVPEADDEGNRLVVVTSGDWFIVKSTDLASEPTIDAATGELSYDIKADSTATLAEVLETLDETQLASIKKIEITEQITEVSNATLKLVKLESLDLSKATNLADPTLDLDGVSIDTVVMSKDTAITKVALTAGSEVKTINAAGTAALVSIDLASNKNIETVDVSETSVDVVDASGCTNLKTLNTKGAKVTTLNVTGCENLTDLDCSAAEEGQGEIASLDLTTCVSLEQLDVSANRLVVLDLSKNAKLTGEKTKLGGQKSAQKFTRSLEFNLLSFILNLLGLTSDNGYAANITRVYAVDEDGTETEAVYESGTAMFDAAPNSIKYYFDTKLSASAQTEALLAADSEFEMDVTLEGTGTAEEKEPDPEEPTSISSSSGGCQIGVSLGALAALMAFAKLFKKR